MMKSIFALLLSASYVAAHGFLYQVIIDGTTYQGNQPAASPTAPSIIREISTISPVKGANNSNLNCGQDAQPASLVGNAMPGSTVSFNWKGGDLQMWPHNTGPIMTYLANCGSVPCSQYNPMPAEWFLIDRQGQYPNGTWVQASIMTGALVTVTIPSNLAPGNYMVRHEIIALQLAVSVGGAEFYPSCSQIQVGGSQTGKPQQSDLVTFPGGYTDTEPGIYDPNVYNPGAQYTFPGPPIASFIAGSSSTGGSSTGGSSTSGGSSSGGSSTYGGSSSTGTSSATPASTPSSGSCRLRRSSSGNSTTSNTRRALQFHRRLHKPRSISRIMRDVIFGEESF
ncbi:hypothetical protein AX14_006699 [Amanita brunnescens Koide BX004]|nr:hypothetical protein AX14_006699 [Amanita brunnescens Koide BX004]